MPTAPANIMSMPGIKRDGTRLEGKNYIDGQWCRWARGFPRKIAGYRTVDSSLTEKVYGMHAYVTGGSEYVHAGSNTKLVQRAFDYNGTLLTSTDRTPAALVTSAYNMWQFDVLYDSTGAANRILAHAATNLSDISQSTAAKVWYGTVSDTAILTDSTASSVSGGVCAVAPYAFAYGSDGYVNWCVPNKPADWAGAGSGTARITGAKIVRGLPLRGNGSGPAALFWSLDSLVRGSYVGGTTIWSFDTISEDQSILSSNGAVEYDGIYYWAGVDRFLMFNGVVREVPNQMNLDWFFDNVNLAYRQKVFVFKVPRWGEIWWCYPRGSATECTHAVIYNVREGTWYDTQLPDSGRSSGTFAKVYEHPLLTGVDLTSTSTYRIIKHEEGVDAVDGSDVSAIQSYFETAEITNLESQQPSEKSLSVVRIEPDFVQTGPMTVTVRGRSNARADVNDGTAVSFPDVATSPSDQTVKSKDVYRLMSFKFESNEAGADYVAGDCYAHIGPADGRVES